MPITCSFESRIEIDLNWYLKDVIRHLLKGLLHTHTHTHTHTERERERERKRETLCLCG